MEVSQYKIVIVNLDPTVGSEIKKTRPCVVISPNELNRFLKTIIIAPLTTSQKDYPTRVKVNYQNSPGRIAIDQIRTIDKSRILVFSDHYLSKREIEEVKDTINKTFVR
ncbi:MAG: mRNA interferase MazF [Saprospiraceae bacterium]|jgi:mRNA interferase MazF